MRTQTSRRSYLDAGATGLVAGTLASGVQTLVGWTIDQTLLPRGQDNNIAPRFVDRSARQVGLRPPPAVDWILGTLFHFGYGMVWGVAFGLVRCWSRVPSLALGGGLGGLLYLLAFSRIGIGTKTGTEQQPERRPWQKQVSLVSVAVAYALSLPLIFDRLQRRQVGTQVVETVGVSDSAG